MKKKILATILTAAIILTMGLIPKTEAKAGPYDSEYAFRLYSPVTGEHFYTTSINENNTLVDRGWKQETWGWLVQTDKNDTKTPVYRLYNPVSRDHLYTTDENEKNVLSSKHGWKAEGIAFYSVNDSGTGQKLTVYRLFNPNAITATHFYTARTNEVNALVKAGWKKEGVAWYGLGTEDEIGNIDYLPSEVHRVSLAGKEIVYTEYRNGMGFVHWVWTPYVYRPDGSGYKIRYLVTLETNSIGEHYMVHTIDDVEIVHIYEGQYQAVMKGDWYWEKARFDYK